MLSHETEFFCGMIFDEGDFVYAIRQFAGFSKTPWCFSTGNALSSD
jgi:hypothetical protein